MAVRDDFVKVVKIIVSLVAIAILIVALLAGFTVLDFRHIGPWQHERNTEKAEISNQVIWETGFAKIYTIEVAVKVAGEIRSGHLEMVCVPKTETETIGIKGGPYVWDKVRNFSPWYSYITVSDGYRAIVSTKHLSCDSLARNAKEQGFPFELADYQRLSARQRIAEARVSCFGPSDGKVSQYYAVWADPITVLSGDSKRVRDVLTREEYGAADRAIVRKRERELNKVYTITSSSLFLDSSFYWSNEGKCWRNTLDYETSRCSSLARLICEPSP